MQKEIRNIAIMAHVDAGKTTLSEQFLFRSGKTNKLGNVDRGTTNSDFLSVEKERGISIQSATLVFNWNGVKINVLDTPGHADFMSEVERSLLAIDAVILVISAAEGVQAQTFSIWNMLNTNHIPTIFFINKLDRVGVNVEEVIREIQLELSNHIILLQEENSEGKLISFWNKDTCQKAANTIEMIVEQDDDLLEAFVMEQEISFQTLDRALVQSVQAANLFPIFFGVAKTGLGVVELLDAIVHFLPAPQKHEEFSAIVYKIKKDPRLGRLAFVRILGGVLNKKEEVYNQRLRINEKANQLMEIFSNSLKDVAHLRTGEIGVVSGFQNVQIGDILGKSAYDSMQTSSSTILTTRIKNSQKEDYHKLAEALYELNLEDPTLQFEWLKEQKEFHLHVKGWIQMQILESLLKEQYGIEASFENPQVIYKETPVKEGFGYEEYTMPKPCWAIVKLHIEPMPKGYGVQFLSNVSVDEILLKYQKEVERSIPKALKQGIKGWEVTDLKISLVGGEHHNVHSRSGDFVVATPMAILNGLKEIDTHLLEPILNFRVIAPEEMLGRIASDLNRMRASFGNPKIEKGKFQMEGKIPLATSLDYPIKLSSRSGGKAKIFTVFDSYEKVESHLGKQRDFHGISPLDRAKYILQARKAIQ